jgi:DNA-binding transcriptional MocR family regulator
MAGQADNRAPYAKIAAHYAELITSGQLEPGTLLPSIKNLAEEWKVSTAQRGSCAGHSRHRDGGPRPAWSDVFGVTAPGPRAPHRF